MGFGGVENTKGEARWHGCCLALAEMARRGLISDEHAIKDSVYWVLRVSNSHCENSHAHSRLCCSTSAELRTLSEPTFGMLLRIWSGRCLEHVLRRP